MMFLDNYDGFKYTKIQVPITLNKCPSDATNCEDYFDINYESFTQKKCYIEEQLIEEITIRHTECANKGNRKSAPKWQVEMIISEVKTEDEVIQILQKFCRILSLRCAQSYFKFCNSGLHGFSFRAMDIRRSYAGEDCKFSDIVFNENMGMVLRIERLTTIDKNIFVLPKSKYVPKSLYKSLADAFLIALGCKDAISRYILMYYLFEIIYETKEYKDLKAEYENSSIYKKENAHTKRSEILYQYFSQIVGLTEYSCIMNKFVINAQILEQIILVRNNITHRADTSQIHKILYEHLIPILQKTLTLLE